MNAKESLDKLIKKSRVHFYKPIQVAEILYRYRVKGGFDIEALELYRNESKRWRDQVSLRLIGSVSTSSQKYQDNVFEGNAMLPSSLAELAKINNENGGLVEAYIYLSFWARLSSVFKVMQYIENTPPSSFSLMELVEFFIKQAGLKRSVDKIYEITVYALFSTIVRALNVQITLAMSNKDEAILSDFKDFISSVLGIPEGRTEMTLPAALYRVGVANAADSGLDMWANFGPAVQVKHLTLTPELVTDIVGAISAERIVIVCVDAEKESIEALLKQVGWSDRVQGIITLTDLHNWYQLCTSKKYLEKLGNGLLKDVQREFKGEFPSIVEIEPFLKERNYDKIALPKQWEIIR